MDWYYVDNGQQAGPVSEADFLQLASSGKITPDTLVWNESMPDWIAYREAVQRGNTPAATPTLSAASPPGSGADARLQPSAQPIPAGSVVCAECGNPTPHGDAIQYGSVWVCAPCKPAFVQKLKEGVIRGPGAMGSIRYAGFWIRFLAKFVDGLITSIVNLPLSFLLGATAGPNAEPEAMIIAQVLSTGANIVVSGAYAIFFIGRYGATPGKMVCKLHVITADGGRVSYARATGRFFAEMLSGCPTIFIGYIIAAFDDEKRALHDHICSTRVVYKD